MALLKRLITILIVVSSLIGFAYAAETDWTLHIKVSVPDPRGADGTVWNHLVAGARDGATDGFDSHLDTLSMVEADDPVRYDPVQSMFIHGTIPEDKNNDGLIDRWACNNPEDGYNHDQCSLWRDIRAFGADKVWPFLVLSTLNGGTVTLQWSFEDKPENIEVLLVDLANPAVRMDMKNVPLHSYTNTLEPGKRYAIHSFEIRMKAKGLFIKPPLLPDATVDTPYRASLSAVGGTPVWSLSDGDLPPGMSIHPFTGELTGTPTVTGTYRFTVRGDDTVSGYSSSREYVLNIHSIPKMDGAGLQDGVVGTDYSGRIPVVGGSAPFTWSVLGNLPEGLTLDSSTGILSGRLIVPGVYDFTVVIRDGNGATDSKAFRITVMEPEDRDPPAAIGDLRGTYVTETSMLLLWTAPTDDSMTHTAALYDLRYLEDCSDPSSFLWDRAIEVSGEPRPQAGALQTYTLTGLRPGRSYCIAIKGMDAPGHLSALSKIMIWPSSSADNGSRPSVVTSSITLNKGYNLISFPMIPVPNGRESLFGPVVGSPVSLYRWYSAYPGITPPQYYLEDVVQPGYGYFLYSPADQITFKIDGLKIEEREYRVALQGGWNMIGTPYQKSILLRAISVKDNITGEKRDFVDAVKAGWIGNTLYYLGEGGYDFASFNEDPPAAFEPWIGYWIYVGKTDGVEVIFGGP